MFFAVYFSPFGISAGNYKYGKLKAKSLNHILQGGVVVEKQ